jgi:hypothetical protein
MPVQALNTADAYLFPNRAAKHPILLDMEVMCDARSHMVSERTDWRADMVGDSSPG